MAFEYGKKNIRQRFGKNILRTNLDYRRSFGACQSQQRSKVKIMGKDNKAMLACPFHNNIVGCARIADL
ncbi:MAG: hypothetical protein OHK0010_33530 [Anaerolineales bacterium]